MTNLDRHPRPISTTTSLCPVLLTAGARDPGEATVGGEVPVTCLGTLSSGDRGDLQTVGLPNPVQKLIPAFDI